MLVKNYVDVILPVFNSEKLIIKTVNSIINQSYKNWKIIIIDDASSDRTLVLLNKFYKNLINKKKIVIFKNMLKKNNLLNFLILIKFFSKVIKIILLLSKFFSYISDAFYKFEYKIIIKKKNKPKVKNLIIANRFLI